MLKEQAAHSPKMSVFTSHHSITSHKTVYVIYSYKRNQQEALCLYFDMQIYVFQPDLLSIIRSLDTVFRAIGICIQEGISKLENSGLKM